jgi:hypothetical protein
MEQFKYLIPKTFFGTSLAYNKYLLKRRFPMSKALSLFHDFWNDFSSPIASGRGVLAVDFMATLAAQTMTSMRY